MNAGMNQSFHTCVICKHEMFHLEVDKTCSYTFHWCSRCGSLESGVRAHGSRSRTFHEPMVTTSVKKGDDTKDVAASFLNLRKKLCLPIDDAP